MGIERLMLLITRLIAYWQEQGIAIISKTALEIDYIEKANFLHLPSDFKEFYKRANGMGILYPNDIDSEGFLIYPVEAIKCVSAEFESSGLIGKDKIFIFAEYMHKSWWYGYELIDNGDYVIGIIQDENTFKPITNSLEEFIELYLENSSRLYEY